MPGPTQNLHLLIIMHQMHLGVLEHYATMKMMMMVFMLMVIMNEEDEDDPADADFDPDYGVHSGGNKVMKFGNASQIDVRAAPPEAQIELFDALIDGCKEAAEGENIDPKGPLLDFFGVPVKVIDLLHRVQELQLLAKRISRYANPIAQFCLLVYLKPSNWSKGCGWNQIDDASLLLGIHYHGFGSWEKIRLDERLGLSKKIAPVELQHHENFLPRAPNLSDRANALLEMLIGWRVDQIVLDYDEEPYGQDSIRYVHLKLSVPFPQKGHDDTWRCQRRAGSDVETQPPLLRPASNGVHVTDPNSLGILGAAPADSRRLNNDRAFGVRQTGFPHR